MRDAHDPLSFFSGLVAYGITVVYMCRTQTKHTNNITRMTPATHTSTDVEGNITSTKYISSAAIDVNAFGAQEGGHNSAVATYGQANHITPSICYACGERNTGTIFMLNDRPYCCQAHRITAYTDINRQA